MNIELTQSQAWLVMRSLLDFTEEANIDKIAKEWPDVNMAALIEDVGLIVKKLGPAIGLKTKLNQDAVEIKAPWLVLDPLNGDQTFCTTEPEALAVAKQMLNDYNDGDGWPEETEDVMIAKVVWAAKQTDREERPPNLPLDQDAQAGEGDDAVDWPSGCEYRCDYRMEQIQQ